MMLVVAVLKNGRLVFVMLLFGWNRAAMDLQNLYEGVVEGLRDWKLLKERGGGRGGGGGCGESGHVREPGVVPADVLRGR